MTHYSIGKLARHAGVAIDTVRYYERCGLLRPAERLFSGYRRYGEFELRQLRFIRRAKRLGFTVVARPLKLDAQRLTVTGPGGWRAIAFAQVDRVVDRTALVVADLLFKDVAGQRRK